MTRRTWSAIGVVGMLAVTLVLPALTTAPAEATERPGCRELDPVSCASAADRSRAWPVIRLSRPRGFTVGEFGSVVASVRGGHPPYRTRLVTSDLNGTGLEVNGTRISGTPSHAFRADVRVITRDSAGRRAVADYYLRATYPKPEMTVVTQNNGQDAEGNLVADPSVATGGRLVAFASGTDLVPEDDNGLTDVYLKDLDTGAVTLVSRGLGGRAGDDSSMQPALSANGEVIAFFSGASNLTSDGRAGVFAYAVSSGELTWIGEGDYPSVSSDGKRIVYQYEYEGLAMTDLGAGATRVYQVPGYVDSAQISGDGGSAAVEVWSYDDLPSKVVLVDLDTRRVRDVSRLESGLPMDFDTRDPAINHDGTVVAFSGSPWGPRILGAVYLKNMATGEVDRIQNYVEVDRLSLSASGDHLAYGILTCSGDYSAIGYYSAVTGDRRVLNDSRTDRSSRGSAMPSLSADGRYVAFAGIPRNGPIDILLADVILL